MTDFQSTLDTIDDLAVHHCGHCDAPLGPEAPSTLFCTPEHQGAFYAARSEALVGYREPMDLPQHVYNLVEESSPETTRQSTAGGFTRVASQLWIGEAFGADLNQETVRVLLHTSGEDIQWWTTGPRVEGTDNWARNGADGVHVTWGPPVDMDSRWLQIGLSEWSVNADFQLDYEVSDVLFLAAQPEPPRLADHVERALEFRRNRNTGPQQSRRAPRRIDPRRSR